MQRTWILALALLAGCALNSNEKLNGLIGKTLADATMVLGRPPESIVDLGGGKRAAQWSWSRRDMAAIGWEYASAREIVTVVLDGDRVIQWNRALD
jgi:hypothetical protein